MTRYEQAHKDYLQGMKYKEIAEKYGVSLATVKSWKIRYGWSRKKTQKSMHTKHKSMHTKKRGAPIGNHNALYNSGGAPEQNFNAVKHGLLSKHLPAEIMGIINDLDEISHIDILWQNIVIQHAKIIHAQKVLFVESSQSHLEVTEKLDSVFVTTDGSSSKKVVEHSKIIIAQDIESKAMGALSRAMGTLNNMIKQYDELCRSDLATEEQRMRIEKIKTDVSQISMKNTGVEVDMTGYIEALNPVADDVWSDEDGTTEE